MNEIFLKQIDEVTPFWVFYSKDSGEPGNIQLSACANNFSIHRGYVSEDSLQCVGVRYEKDGFGCYELYNVGHTLIKCPLKPNPIQKLLAAKRPRRSAGPHTRPSSSSSIPGAGRPSRKQSTTR